MRFVRVGVPMTCPMNMYDTSPESWAKGAVYRLLLMSVAFCYLQSKKQNSYFAQVSTFVTYVACFFAEKISIWKYFFSELWKIVFAWVQFQTKSQSEQYIDGQSFVKISVRNDI